jgi:hypothetical protein
MDKGKELHKTIRKAGMSRDLLKHTILALLTEAPGLGEIQLRKALVMIDILNESYFGKGLTGTSYIKYPHGPVPDDDSWQIILSMLREQKIFRKEEPVGTWTKHAYYMMASADYTVFNDDQIGFIGAAARFALKNTANQLSEMTHDETYHNTPMGAVIPLSAMFDIRVKPSRKLTEHQKTEIRNALDADDYVFGAGRRQETGSR